MTEITIEQLRVPDTLDGDSAAEFLQAVEVSRKVRVNTWGNDELAYTAEELFQLCHDPYEWYVVLVVRLDGAIVGRAGIALPLDDNTDLAHVTLDVLPAAEGRGLGRKLLEAAELFVRGENRRIVVVETNHPAADLRVEAPEHVAATRDGSLMPLSSREALFAHNAGYVLEQVEQFGACALPLPPALGGRLKDRAIAAHSSAYAVHRWMDTCPEKWAQDIVRLEQSISDDDGAPEAWDVAKLREAEELSALTGRHTLVSAAECLETGALVAFTSISVLKHRDDVAFQDDTVVDSQHRGKDVGLHIKVENMEQLTREFPQVKTLYTWNSPDNTYMLSVNAQLGFVSAGVTGQWRKDFNAID
ncbi:GNAT family N-acetyltransferase [Arthrobacter glacialis]|uniref:GNAT family N-acetyltransferase n=1 Tax=Arthrobacter glacialis TaxID=1664 RepID=UPI001A9EC1C9|nr:GNAT family N-acetyltransferase [Arthrobacter glacialis]